MTKKQFDAAIKLAAATPEDPDDVRSLAAFKHIVAAAWKRAGIRRFRRLKALKDRRPQVYAALPQRNRRRTMDRTAGLAELFDEMRRNERWARGLAAGKTKNLAKRSGREFRVAVNRVVRLFDRLRTAVRTLKAIPGVQSFGRGFLTIPALWGDDVAWLRSVAHKRNPVADELRAKAVALVKTLTRRYLDRHVGACIAWTRDAQPDRSTADQLPQHKPRRNRWELAQEAWRKRHLAAIRFEIEALRKMQEPRRRTSANRLKTSR